MANTMQLIQPQLANTALPGVEPLQQGGAEQPWFKETASQTWGIGDLIYIDTNGTLAICTNGSGITNGNVLSSVVAGQAQAAASGTTGKAVSFHAIRSDDVYIMNVFHATLASAVLAATLVGTRKGIRYTVSGDGAGITTGIWCVDLQNAVESTNNAGAYVKIVGFPQTGVNSAGTVVNTTTTDTYGLVYVQFLPFSIYNTFATIRYNLQLSE